MPPTGLPRAADTEHQNRELFKLGGYLESLKTPTRERYQPQQNRGKTRHSSEVDLGLKLFLSPAQIRALLPALGGYLEGSFFTGLARRLFCN